MAKNNAAKTSTPATNSASKSSKLPSLLVIISFTFCVALLAFLLAADQSINFMNTTMLARKYGIGLIAGFCAFAMLAFFMNSKTRNARISAHAALQSELKSQVEALIAKADAKIENYLGAEHERLITENAQYKQQIEQVEKEKEAELAAQIEELRKKNTELQEQINKWAATPKTQPNQNNNIALPAEDSLQVG